MKIRKIIDAVFSCLGYQRKEFSIYIEKVNISGNQTISNGDYYFFKWEDRCTKELLDSDKSMFISKVKQMLITRQLPDDMFNIDIEYNEHTMMYNVSARLCVLKGEGINHKGESLHVSE